MKYMYENNSFSVCDFKTPSYVNAPVYSWIWNGPVTREETDRQLLEMQSLGIRFIYIIPEPKLFRPLTIPTFLEPDYLTPAYFEEFKYAMVRARELGMHAWLYDEGGWPSGGACGKVVLEHPEYAARVLSVRSITLSANTPYAPAEDTIGAFINVTEPVDKGATFASDTDISEYFIENKLCDPKGRPTADIPDITLAGATDEFIRLTHEGYKPYLEELFPDTISAVFTDEPTAPRPLMRDDLIEKFETRYGYSILPYLPYIRRLAEAKGDAAEALISWYDLCSEEFCSNYLLKEKKWSNEHGLCFMGHLDIDHIPGGSVKGGTFNMMRALRCLDVPGVDAIWRQIFPCERTTMGQVTLGDNGFFPRYASSAAAQVGGRYALTESFGVYGAGLSYDEMRWTLGFQAIRGINIFNLMLVPYRRKGANMTGELPCIIPEQTHFAHLKTFNEWAERVSYLASLGKKICDVALYLPIRDTYCGGETESRAANSFTEAGKALERMHVDFDVIDDDVLRTADLSCGRIKMGNAEYRTIVIDKSFNIHPEARIALEGFEAAGGSVISFEEIPTLSPDVKFISDSQNMRVMRRELQNGSLVLIFNESFEKESISVDLEGKKHYLISPEDGGAREYTDGDVLTLEAGEIVGFISTGEPLFVRNETEYTSELALTDFTIARDERFVIGYMEYERERYNDDPISATLGDWRGVVGEGYSGSCIYRTTFSGIPEGKVRVDLGDVKYVAELFINGRFYGKKIMKPYVFDVDLTPEDTNTLEIRVTNTPANEYNTTHSFDKWQRFQLTPYHDKAIEFHKDSLPSGLFGPVIIRY